MFYIQQLSNYITVVNCFEEYNEFNQLPFLSFFTVFPILFLIADLEPGLQQHIWFLQELPGAPSHQGHV